MLPLNDQRRSFRLRHGFTLLEVMIGVLIASLIAGASLSALIQMFSHASRPNVANDGLQLSQNVATDFQTLAAYNPSFLSSLKVGQTFLVTPSYSQSPTNVSQIPVTVTAVNAQPSASSRTLGVVTLSWQERGQAQFVNVPISEIAIAEQNCNPAAGIVTDCVTVK